MPHLPELAPSSVFNPINRFGNRGDYGGRKPRSKYLQAGIDFGNHVVPAVIGPVAAGLSHRGRNDSLLDQIGLLHGVDVEARAHVPRDMAMQGPHAGVVGVVLNDNKTRARRTSALNDLHVPALCVGRMHNGAVPCANAFGKNVEVVTVQMHWVRGAGVVLDDDTHAVVVSEVVDVPLLPAMSIRLELMECLPARQRGYLRDQTGRKCCRGWREAERGGWFG